MLSKATQQSGQLLRRALSPVQSTLNLSLNINTTQLSNINHNNSIASSTQRRVLSPPPLTRINQHQHQQQQHSFNSTRSHTPPTRVVETKSRTITTTTNNNNYNYNKSTNSFTYVLTRPLRSDGGVVLTTPLVRHYHENVIDHYENPRNVGSLDKSAPNVGTGLVGAPACGDVMKLQIQVDDQGKIVDAKFKTFGCGSAIASSSYTTTWLQGKTLDEALKIKNTDIASHLNLPPVKLHCSMLAEDAVKAAITDLKKKQLPPQA